MVDTGDSEPVSQKPYPIMMKHYKWVKDEINKHLTVNVIWISQSSWSAPISDTKGRWRKTSRHQLSCTQQDHTKIYLAYAKGRRHFCSTECCKIFLNLGPTTYKQDITTFHWMISKTTFTSPFRKYGYIKIPFRLPQAPAYFQELMTGVLKDFPFTIAYLDDIIIFSRTAEEHLYHIRQVFKKLHNAHLWMQLSKCHFFAKEIQYLGHILSTTGIKPLPSKTQANKKKHAPT